MQNVFIGIYLVCIIRTIIDNSMAISSPMNEIFENNASISEKNDLKSE